MIHVKLIAHTPNPDSIVASAAKLCYSKSGVEEINKNLTEEKTQAFLKKLTDMGHFSPVEHTSFTFAVEGISRTCSHQIVRHRLASYSQQSQRYVNLEQFEYIVPPQIEQNEQAKKIYIEHMENSQKAYNEITKKLYEKNLQELLNNGIDEKIAKNQAEKKSIEDARYVFPNATETKMVITMNARSLHNFFDLRTCERAQWEIRELAYKMLEEVKKVSPLLFKNAGPACVKGVCKEGALSCKRPDIPKERIRKIEENL